MASKKGGYTSIALWNFKDNMNKTSNSISLAETITKTECKVADNCIAPGTEGKFDFIVNAKGSKVKIDYQVKLIKEESTPSNLYFFIKGNEEKFSTLSELFEKVNFSGSFDSNDNKKIKVYQINWKWPFETINEDGSINENKDTNFAKQQKDYIFEIEISGKQSI